MSRINAPLRSQSVSTDDTKGSLEAITGDLQDIARSLGQRTIIAISGGDRLVIPLSGVAKVYCVSALTTVGSDGSNYFTVKALRNGQDETSQTRDTRHAEITGYSEFYLGIIQVGKGDVISLQSVMTGGPLYPILTSGNLSMRIELGPQATIR